MSSKTSFSVAILLGVSLLSCLQSAQLGKQTIPADNPPETVAEPELTPLISATELAALLKSDSAGLRVLEPGRDLETFAAGHLPKAQFVHWVDDMTDPLNAETYMKPTGPKFADLMSRLGIENGDRIVIYDRLASRLSTRLYWTLKFYGHDQVQVLDGGFTAWESGFELSTEATEAVASQYKVAAIDEKILAEMAFVEQRLEDPKTRLIDGRPAEQYSGEAPGRIFHTNQEHPRKGHIPGAVNVVWKDNFNADGTFKSAKQLTTLYEQAGVLPDQCVVTYCNEGLHAAPPWFVLTQLLDFNDVRLYDSSMAEWAKSDNPLKKNAK